MDIVKDLYKDFYNGLVHVIEEYPLISGLGFLILGGILLDYELKKRESFNMDEHNIPSWQALVSMWGLILMSFSFAIILIVKKIL